MHLHMESAMLLLIETVAVLILVGLALWVMTQLPIDDTIKKIIRVVIIAAVVVWLVYLMVTVASNMAPMTFPRR